jgi:hypothetical protein
MASLPSLLGLLTSFVQHPSPGLGKMLGRERVSLNQLAFESTCGLIEAVLGRGVHLTEAYIDALGDTTKHKVGLHHSWLQQRAWLRVAYDAKHDSCCGW